MSHCFFVRLNQRDGQPPQARPVEHVFAGASTAPLLVLPVDVEPVDVLPDRVEPVEVEPVSAETVATAERASTKSARIYFIV